MNKDNVEALIRHLEASHPEKFEMCDWIGTSEHHCGTTGCIAGHAVLMNSKPDPRDLKTMSPLSTHGRWCKMDLVPRLKAAGRFDMAMNLAGATSQQAISRWAADWLGISFPEAELLFTPGPGQHGYDNLHEVSRDQAVDMLKLLLRDGEVREDHWLETRRVK